MLKDKKTKNPVYRNGNYQLVMMVDEIEVLISEEDVFVDCEDCEVESEREVIDELEEADETPLDLDELMVEVDIDNKPHITPNVNETKEEKKPRPKSRRKV